jgi:Na+/melibiose symporter-like transporter
MYLKIRWAIVATILIFFVSLLVISPIISKLGYSSVESSYHLLTHSLIVSLIFTVIVCTMSIHEEINEIKAKFGDGKNEE